MSAAPFRHYACNTHARNYECFNAGCTAFCGCAWCTWDIMLPSAQPSTLSTSPLRVTVVSSQSSGYQQGQHYLAQLASQYTTQPSQQIVKQQPQQPRHQQYNPQQVSQPAQQAPQPDSKNMFLKPDVSWEETLRRQAAEAEFKRQEEVKNAEHEHRLAEIEAATRALREGGRELTRSTVTEERRSGRTQEGRRHCRNAGHNRDPLLYYPADHEDDSTADADEEVDGEVEQQDGARRRDPLLYYPPGDEVDQDDDSENEDEEAESKDIKAEEIVSAPTCEVTNRRKRAATEQGGRKSAMLTERQAKKVKVEEEESDGEIVVAVKDEDDPFL